MADPDSRIDDVEILAAMACRDAFALSTTEIADALDLTPQAALYRLRQLEAAGDVEQRDLGNAYAWRLTGAGRARAARDRR